METSVWTFFCPQNKSLPRYFLSIVTLSIVFAHAYASTTAQVAPAITSSYHFDSPAKTHSYLTTDQKKNLFSSDEQEATVDTRLDDVAVGQGYGYKTANLEELTTCIQDQTLQANLKTVGCTVEVPQYKGIASPALVAYLTLHGINLANEWADIAAAVTPEMKAQTFATKQLSAVFPGLVQALGTRLKTFFDTRATIVEQDRNASELYYFFDHLSFINSAHKAKKLFIVRSTGMEDKKGLANAGGNDSFKNVAATVPAVLRAIGSVIKSYFSEKSLCQRLIAGDTTIFQLPLTPVLVQHMVTTTTKRRPIEGVIHTTEQAGPTPGLASFNCGYGVVESTQRADQYYYFHTGQGHGILAQDVEHVPENVRQALRMLATTIENHYQRATDIELLIDTATGKISIVQARPLNRPATLANPSYIKIVSHIPADSIVAADTVVAAGSSVRCVTNSQHIIVAPTLGAALTHYLAPGVDRSTVQAIVVQGEAEPNSHEATTFASDGKLVMVAREYEKVSLWLEEPSVNLYLDGQRGAIVDADTTTLAIVDGYTRHPAPNKVSIEPPATPITLTYETGNNTQSTDLQTLITTLKQGSEQEATAALWSILKHIDTQIASIINATTEKDCPLSTIIYDARVRLEALKSFAHQKAQAALPFLALPSNDLQRLAALVPLEAMLTQSEDTDLENVYSTASVVAQFEQKKSFVEQQLLPALQKAEANALPLRWYNRVKNLFFASKKHAIPNDPSFINAVRMGYTVAMTPELESKWLTFITEAVETPKTQSQLAQLLKTLELFNIMPLWINTIFNAATGTTSEMLTKFLASIQAAQATLKNVASLRKEMNGIPPRDWSNPEKFEQNKQKLQKLVTRFTAPQFVASVINTDTISLAITQSIMNSFVDAVDRSIKAAKASAIDNKIQRVKELLRLYLDLLTAWTPTSTKTVKPSKRAQFFARVKAILKALSKIEPSERKSLRTLCAKIKSTVMNAGVADEAIMMANFHYNWPPDRYLEQIKIILDGLDNDDKQLLPSCDFSVSAALLWSKTAFERHFPQTAEDVFTLIHQNLCSVVGSLTNQRLAPLAAKPLAFIDLETILQHQDLKALIQCYQGIRLIHLSFSADEIKAHYSLPLRNRSAVFDIVYKKATNSAQLIMRFIGERRDRWDNIQAHAIITAIRKPNGLKLQETKLGEQEVELIYDYQPGQDPSTVFSYLSALVSMANQNYYGSIVPEDLAEEDAFSLLKKSPKNIRFCEYAFTAIKKDPIKCLSLCSQKHPAACAMNLACIKEMIAQNLDDHKDFTAYIDLALNGLSFEDLRAKEFAQQIIELLIDRGFPEEALKNIYDAALKDLASNNCDIRIIARKIIKTFIERGIPEEALKTIYDLTVNDLCYQYYYNVRESAQEIIEKIIATSHSDELLKTIYDTALKNLSIDSWNIQTTARMIIEKFIDKGVSEEALRTLTDTISRPPVIYNIIYLKQKIDAELAIQIPDNFSMLDPYAIGGMAKPTSRNNIRYLQTQGVALVVTLTEESLDQSIFAGTTVKNMHLPIPSGLAPTQEQLAAFLGQAQQTTAQGGKIVVHYEHGQNRTGTLLATWLIKNAGMTAERAIAYVREKRPYSINAPIQERFLLGALT